MILSKRLQSHCKVNFHIQKDRYFKKNCFKEQPHDNFCPINVEGPAKETQQQKKNAGAKHYSIISSVDLDNCLYASLCGRLNYPLMIGFIANLIQEHEEVFSIIFRLPQNKGLNPFYATGPFLIPTENIKKP